ncbi:MAG: hypothetical protein ACK55Z_36705, partial [bacterium]
MYVEDYRDKNYLIEKTLKLPAVKPKSMYWESDEWWGDQGKTPQCVGYAWAHWVEDGPIKHEGKPPIVHPTIIYKEAQKIDSKLNSVKKMASYLKAQKTWHDAQMGVLNNILIAIEKGSPLSVPRTPIEEVRDRG